MEKHKTQTDKNFLNLPYLKNSDWREALKLKLSDIKSGGVELNCKDWYFNCRDLKEVISIIQRSGFKLLLIESNIPTTIVSASALGIKADLYIEAGENTQTTNINSKLDSLSKPLFHQGILRSGENIEADGDLFLHGDVNPGAKVSAGGNIMVWGRLLGIAHAGKGGEENAKIAALQLRPLQLRIANQVARGPQEEPEAGLAEEAFLDRQQIVIRPVQIKSFYKTN